MQYFFTGLIHLIYSDILQLEYFSKVNKLDLIQTI